jgi:hypothetical protein
MPTNSRDEAALPLNLQAQLDGLTNSFGHLIEGTSLGMASGELRDGSDIVTFFITLNQNIELVLQNYGSYLFHQLKRSIRFMSGSPAKDAVV